MPDVCIILGSDNDLKAVEESEMLNTLRVIGVSYELSVISAHRHPEELRQYVREQVDGGTLVFIGIAGMAAHLAGAIAAWSYGHRPVIGVPLVAEELQGLDALLSMVRMPPGRPVLVTGIGKSGLQNAAIAACQILALKEPWVAERLPQYFKANTKPVEWRIHQSPRKEFL